MKKILIAEDDQSLARLWKRAFTTSGFEAAVVSDGEMAINHLKQGHIPHVILLDQFMPKRSGTDILEEMSDYISDHQITTIIITAAPEALPHNIHEKVDWVLKKPMPYRVLVDLAKQLTD